MLNNNAGFKYKTPYNGPFEIMQSWNNIILQNITYIKLIPVHMIQTLIIYFKTRCLIMSHTHIPVIYLCTYLFKLGLRHIIGCDKDIDVDSYPYFTCNFF